MTNKTTKYGLMTIAAVLLIAMAFAGVASAGDGSQANPFNASDWNKLDEGEMKALHGTVYIADSDMSAVIYPKFNGSIAFTPDADLTLDFTGYKGTFSGDTNVSTNGLGGLFGYVNLDGVSEKRTLTIQNLDMTNVEVNATSGSKVGGIVGQFIGESSSLSILNITNCNLINSSFTGASGSGEDVGGLVGYAYDAIVNFEDCKAMHCDYVAAGKHVGGLVGYAYSASFMECNVTNGTVASTGGSLVGGLVGAAASASFDLCGVENTSVYAVSDRVGGLVGQAISASKIKDCMVKNCAIASSSINVGGLVGLTFFATGSGITGCVVEKCTIKGSSYVGGLVGCTTTASCWSNNKVLNCAVRGSSTSTNLVCGNKNSMYATCTADVTMNFIYNGSTYADTITLNKSDGNDCSLNEYFWNNISYTYATSTREVSSPAKVTNLGTYGVVGGYGVGSAPTLSYNENGATSGTAPAKQTYAPGSTVTVIGKGNLDKTGYEFIGWYNESTGLLGEGDLMYIIDDVTLFANWSAIGYNITYNNMSGATNPATNPATYNVTSSDITLVDAYKMGYTFEGWYNESVFTVASRNNTIPTGSTGDKAFYANWTVNTTTVTASGNYAEFGNENITAIHSTSGVVVNVLLMNVSNVTVDTVTFTADNTTVHIPDVSGYTKEEIAVFEIEAEAAAVGPATINVTVTFNDAANATAYKDKVRFFHYAESVWEPQNSTIVAEDNEKVTYMVETTSFSPFGFGIYVAHTYTVKFDANGGQGSMADMSFTYDEAQNLNANTFQRYNSNFVGWLCNGIRYDDKALVNNLTPEDGGNVTMVAQWETYSTGGSTSGSSYLGSSDVSVISTQQPTVAPTVAPTAEPTPATPTVIATAKPTTQATQQSPAPFVGILAGLGAAAVLLRLRK